MEKDAPRTVEGRAVWHLLTATERQLRVVQGAVVGFDLGAMLAVARAMGVCPVAAAELLTAAEPVAVHHMNERIKSDD